MATSNQSSPILQQADYKAPTQVPTDLFPKQEPKQTPDMARLDLAGLAIIYFEYGADLAETLLAIAAAVTKTAKGVTS